MISRIRIKTSTSVNRNFRILLPPQARIPRSSPAKERKYEGIGATRHTLSLSLLLSRPGGSRHRRRFEAFSPRRYAVRPYLPPSWLFTTLVTFFVARDKDKFPRPILEHIVKSFRLVSGGGRALVRRDKREKEGGEGSIDAISSLRRRKGQPPFGTALRKGERRKSRFNLIPVT